MDGLGRRPTVLDSYYALRVHGNSCRHDDVESLHGSEVQERPPDLCAEGYKVDDHGMGLAGWTVKAFSSTNPTEVLSTVTDEEGYYRSTA